jgi:hypothetical protein
MDSPTPAEVDEKAKRYYALKETLVEALQAAKDAQLPLGQLADELIETVRKFGSAHAEKSKILHGIEEEIMVTFGLSVSIDAAAVERFRVALAESEQSRLCAKIFDKTIRWSLMPDSAATIKSSKLSKPLLALYSQCEVIKPRSPSLTVRSKS